MGQPLSVFFSAQRSEDYDEGGEAYLTFNGKCNLISTLLKRYYILKQILTKILEGYELMSVRLWNSKDGGS